jgi:class 3 adenylate cyclase
MTSKAVSKKINMKNVTLAIVFLDIISSTKFVQKNGAVVSAAWFQVHDKLARSLVYKHQGREIDRSDGFMLSFDDIGDAVSFAIAYQKTIPNKTPFNSRIGIHWTSVIEILQDDKYTAVGAKRVELEGIGKATAARCMSICQKKQILLTKDAHDKLRSTSNVNKFINKETRIALVGLYSFKGVKNPQEIYAIGNSIEVLQPPPDSEKVKRVGGAKKIKSRARDRKIKEWFWHLAPKLAIVSFLFILYSFYPVLKNKMLRQSLGIEEYFFWIDYIQAIYNYLSNIIEIKR